MTRSELEAMCISALDSGRDHIRLMVPGDPSAARIRLFGHRLGPRGTVVGWRGDKVEARFDASQVLAYLDQLPMDSDIFA